MGFLDCTTQLNVPVDEEEEQEGYEEEEEEEEGEEEEVCVFSSNICSGFGESILTLGKRRGIRRLVGRRGS